MSVEPVIQLRDKVAIVTGASRGIGENIARTFAKAGAKVVLASRKIDALKAVQAGIEADGGEAFAHACHTGSREQVEGLVAAAVERFGKVDVLVNNAATNPYFGPMTNIEEAAWDKTFEVNVKGYFYATRAVAQQCMARKAPGSIVNVASVAGLMAMPLQGVYAMTKASVISMTKTLAMELGSAGIRVNAIAPGLVDTKFASALTTNDEIMNMVLGRTALKRVAQPHEISGIALLLASDAGSYFTGETVVVDGGWTL
ncbi:glucose 1-dehydrogenase [Sandaracinus amylolyticus]|uniref:glucose 1-dehydrogenase n=1 Tax=Sandaracinus amylolyticus TaxID=927083 RepID=UPI003AF38B64